MESYLIPFLPPGLSVEVLTILPDAACTAILAEALDRFNRENEYAGISEMFEAAERDAEAFVDEQREREAEAFSTSRAMLYEFIDGVSEMFEAAERSALEREAAHTEFITGVNTAHNYDDLERLFERFPSARFMVRMYSGKVVTCTPRSFESLLVDHYGDYNDLEDVDGNFEILSVIQHSFEVDELIRQHIATAMGPGWQQPELGGIDDVRYSIAEFFKEGDYYVPTNINCVGKCIFKFLEISGHNLQEFPELETINFDTVTTIPEMNALLKKKKSQVRVASYTTRPNEYYRDFLTVPIYKYELPEKRGYFHAVLILDVKKYRNLWLTSKKLPVVEVSLSYTEFEDLDQDALDIFYENERQKKFKPPREPPKNRAFASFDFETRRDTDNAIEFYPGVVMRILILSPTRAIKTCEDDKIRKSSPPSYIFKQVPVMLTWAWSPRHADYALDLDNPVNVINGKFMAWLKQKLVTLNQRAAKGDNTLREVVLFTFNGAVFDNHLFVGYLDHPEWKVCPRGYLGDETSIKRFSIKNTTLKFKNKVTFLDIRLFFPPNVSLKKACKLYGGEQKDDFDIVAHMTVDKILGNLEQYVKYGLQDSRALYDIAMKHRKALAEASEKPELDMFDCVSIADYSNRLCDLYHPQDVPMWYNKRDEVAEFERNCVMGGMVIVQDLKCDEPTISVDYNGLYGSSMALYKHPAGKRDFFNRKCHPDKMDEFKHNLNAVREVGDSERLFEAKVRFRVNPLCTIPILRVKDDLDPKNLTKTGYFSNIDLQRAVKHGGYTIEEVLFVMEFELKEEIYRDFIERFNLKRSRHKTAMKSLKKDSDEYNRHNVLQEVCKLITNSSYGSKLLKPFEKVYTSMYVSTFMRNNDPTLEIIGKCGRNQILVMYRNRCKNNNTRTIYQGVFILSYSKVIFDKALVILNAFRTVGTVLYGDTDSVYIRKSDLHLLEEGGLIGDALGQAKNDYGDRIIERFRCLGKKMKMCQLDDGEIKCTIKGFQGLNNLSHTQKEDFIDTFDHVIRTHSTDVFMTKTYETMQRGAFHIRSVAANRSFRMTAHEQCQVVGTKCYPLHYDISNIPS